MEQQIEKTREYLTIPKICPYCGKETKIVISETGVQNLICTNPDCNSKLVNRVDHYLGIKGLNVKGISIATIQKWIDWGWINNIIDVYYLTQYRNEFIKKEGFGVKSVDNILNAIEDSKENVSLNKFIAALGIPLIGTAVAKELARTFKAWKAFRNAVNDENYHFWSIAGFGSEMDKAIKNFDYFEADEIVKMLSFTPVEEQNLLTNNKLKGKSLCVTGKLTKFKNRNELKAKIEELDGKVTGSVSSKTFALINNDINSTSSKNETAKKLGIPILTEEDFIKQYIEN